MIKTMSFLLTAATAGAQNGSAPAGIWSIVLGILFFGTLMGIYIFLFLLNKKTPKPEGCENLKADCGGCKDYSCSNNPLHNQKNQEDQL